MIVQYGLTIVGPNGRISGIGMSIAGAVVLGFAVVVVRIEVRVPET